MEVSVIIPTYKPQEYIYECLESLKNQTLNKEIFEVLLVLNGDKEPYYTDIKKWIRDNDLKNFKLFYSEVAGVSNARNVALDLSQGEYIVFIDDDDYVDNSYLEELLIKNKEIGKDGIVVTEYIRFRDSDKKIDSKVTYNFKSNTILSTRKVFSMVWIKSIPKKIIGNTKFNIKYKNGEDALFMLEISKNIKIVKKIDKKVFYWRRIRDNSAYYNKKTKRSILKNSRDLIVEYSKFFLKKDYNFMFILIRVLAIIKGTIFQLKNNR